MLPLQVTQTGSVVEGRMGHLDAQDVAQLAPQVGHEGVAVVRYDVIAKAAPNIAPFSILFVCLDTTTKRWEQRKGCSGKLCGGSWWWCWCSHDKEAEG